MFTHMHLCLHVQMHTAEQIHAQPPHVMSVSPSLSLLPFPPAQIVILKQLTDKTELLVVTELMSRESELLLVTSGRKGAELSLFSLVSVHVQVHPAPIPYYTFYFYGLASLNGPHAKTWLQTPSSHHAVIATKPLLFNTL